MGVLRSNPGFAVVALLTLALARRTTSLGLAIERPEEDDIQKKEEEENAELHGRKAEVFFKESGSDGKRAAVSIVEKDGEREKGDDAGQLRW